jgi:hypothetical protein
MHSRLLFAIVVLGFWPAISTAGVLPSFDAHGNVWMATHIVVTEGGKVVESWKGDLNVGDTLPEGAAKFTRIAVPDVESGWELPGQKLAKVTGKRMILFLAYRAPEGEDPKKPVWMGATWSTYLFNQVYSTISVAWVEGDDVYTAVDGGLVSGSRYALIKKGTVAGLKQRADLGLALKAEVAAATAEKDLGRRADRLVAIAPFAEKYHSYALSDCLEAISSCGKAGVPHLIRWAYDQNAQYRSEAFGALCSLGDEGFDGVAMLLTDEAGFWSSALHRLEPAESIDHFLYRDRCPASRGPHHLRSLLSMVHWMKLSKENRERLRNLTALKKLDKTLDEPGMKPEKTPMIEAHEILKDILAGKFKG